MIYKFDDFELDPQLRELRRKGAAADVEPQVFDLLCYLVQNAAHVVSKDELFEHVWKGRIVSESTLSSRINAARKILGDDGNRQRFIRTIPKRGFRFVGRLHGDCQPPLSDATVAVDAKNKSAAAVLESSPFENDRPTIAVMPFVNLSGDPDQEFFSDGIAEDIITALSRFRTFFVIARNSSFAYKGRNLGAQQIAEELGVQYLVDGSVRKSGNRIRVAASLNDTKSNQQIWSDRYDRELSDLFEIQDEITESVVGNVAPELLSAEMDRARRQDSPMFDTWSRVMRAHELLVHFDRNNNAKARQLLEEAVRDDPNSSLAFADLAFINWMNITFSWADDIAAEIATLTSNAQHAVALDGRDAWGRCMYGLSSLYGGPDYDAVIRELEASLAINPNMALVHALLGWVLALSGNADRGAPHCELAIRHSPRDPFLSVFWAGYGYVAVGQNDPDKAIECGHRSIACVPPFIGGYRILAAALALSGRLDEARTVGAELLRRAPNMTLEIIRLQQPWKDNTRMSTFLDALRSAGIPD